MTVDSRPLKYKVKKYVTDFFLPNRCPICGKLLKWDRLVCHKCEKNLPVITDDLCEKCGKKVCEEHSSLHFENVYSLFYYRENCIDGIYRLKLDGGLNFAEYCGGKLCDVVSEKGLGKEIDFVTAVPMYMGKRFTRGYNQAEILAKYIAKQMGKVTDFKVLSHHKTSVEQHKLTAEERIANADKSYYENPKHKNIENKTVLLCDDVYTTGATMNACAAILKKLGAKKVICVSIATTE